MTPEAITAFVLAERKTSRKRRTYRDKEAAAGLAPSTVTNWSRKAHNPTLKSLHRVCDLLGLELTVQRKDSHVKQNVQRQRQSPQLDR